MSHTLHCMLYAALFAWAATAPGAARAQGTCGPSSLGSPCSIGGVAVAGQTEPGLNLGVGNPIHLATGNKHQTETDLPANPHSPGLEIVRHYNGLDRRHSVLGQGWALSYDTRLFHTGGAWQIVQADGSRIRFAMAAGKPSANRYGTLAGHGGGWAWTWPTGRRLWFDTHGYLQRISAPDGTELTLHRSQDQGPLKHSLARVESRQGGWLAFSYRIHANQAYLDKVDTPLGAFAYRYDITHAPLAPALRLAGVKRPDGMHKRYLYEAERQAGNAYALTGIGIADARQENWHRLNTWAYDAQGRAILSISGPPDSQAGKIHLSYPQPPRPGQNGLTIVTQAGGQATRFRTSVLGGQHRLAAVSGAPCPGCAAPGHNARYDSQGRLLQLNGTHIQRSPAGRPATLQPMAPGWPGLTLQYNSQGRRHAWHASLTGTERMLYDSLGRPLQRRFQNGDTSLYAYDTRGRPISITDRRGKATHATRLVWQGSRLTRIEHPHATEQRSYDAYGRLSQRHVDRLSAGRGRLSYTESFEYDARHRLRRHLLPEGGALSYHWSPAGRLSAIHWHDAHGATHTVIDSQPGMAGYRYGNGLQLHTRLNPQGQAGKLLLATADGAPVWTLTQHYDKHGLLQQEAHGVPQLGYTETWRHVHNAQGQLIGSQGRWTRASPHGQAAPAQDHLLWFAWHPDGSLAARRHNGVTQRPSVQRDASGLPTATADYRLDYNPQRRLSQVTHKTGELLVRHLHDAFGHRIVKAGKLEHHDYFHLNNQLVAESRYLAQLSDDQAPSPGQPLALSRRYIYAGSTPVGLILYADAAAGKPQQAQLYAIHADLVGAPRLLTDQQGRVRWLAAYEPHGSATRIAGDLTFDLRLPGQVFDAETGWHDNLFRTYLPGSGQYLEPDPLGPLPGSQALGYAAQQPRRHADPLGLILFAFDGTRNSASTQSNIWKLSQAYLDGPVHYHSGPGNAMYIDWDAITAGQAAQIIQNQWLSLLNELSWSGSLTEHIPIDIIGYSRGAALARHFGNLINQYTQDHLFSYHDRQRGLVSACVDLRFMGLFDTVAQFGLAGSQNANYDLSIAAAWEWVAHAVALHERRRTFPLTSAADSQGSNIIEAAFIGAHADIGGGVLPTSDKAAAAAGDLADVALNWMLWQARAATVRFDLSNPSDREITQATLHDERSPLLRSVQDGDRSVSGADGAMTHYYQDSHPALGRSQRDGTEPLITRQPNWRSDAGSAVGTVDMNGYAQWLYDELGWQPLPT